MESTDHGNWRPVNYERFGQYYECSHDGLVRRIGSTVPLHPSRLKNGYPAVHLSCEGVVKTVCVHRIIALTFVSNPDPSRYNQVGHLDESKDNNKANNLIWTCALENNLYGSHIAKQMRTLAGKRNEARRKKKGQKVPVTILRPQPDGGVSGETFSSIAEASRQTGVKKQDIRAVCRGIRRTAGGYRWVFAYVQDELRRIDELTQSVVP